MSHYTQVRVQPTPATQEDVANSINQLRNQLERELREAQQNAAAQATERAARLQQEQIVRIQASIDALDAASRQSLKSMDQNHRKEIRRIQDSFNALDQQSRRNLEAMDKRHRKQLEDISRQVYDDISQTQERIMSRVNNQIADLASDISDQFKGVDRRIQQQQRDIEIINGQIEHIVDDINAMAVEINERFEKNEREITSIHDDIADIRQQFNDKDELARQTVKAAIDLLTIVEGRTMLDRFAPEYEADDIRDRVDKLKHSTLQGDALTAKAEEALTQIWQTERHAIQEKAKHDAMVEIALTQIEKVLTVVNNNREVEQEVEDGDPMKVECDFWSEGEYARLEQEMDRLKAELENRYNNGLTRERIEAIIRRSAEIEKRILQIAAESVARAILSEARVETVEDIVNAMEGKGWAIKGTQNNPEINYMGGEVDHDWRKGVCAVLENNVGEEITIIMDPVSDSLNQLIVHQETSQDGKTDQKVQEQMDTVKAELCDLGYTIGETTSGVARIPEMGSVERLGRAHATDKVRNKIQV